ncbi:MAG TPA: BMC domain-containing protein [Bdellovibrionota bacterium]|nr:BMC domain-containing protein [Bdellovibrionota bacterium]
MAHSASFFQSLGLIELSSIARGFIVADAMVKKAPVQLLLSEAISSGKYLVMVGGDVASVEEALKDGRELAESTLVDELFIPQLHEGVKLGLSKQFEKISILQSLAIVETKTVASAIVACDEALKASEVSLRDLRLGNGIGGKGYFVVSGALHEVQAAHEAAKNAVEARGTLVRSEVVTQAHEDVTQLCI